jgi:hypothetical protein
MTQMARDQANQSQPGASKKLPKSITQGVSSADAHVKNRRTNYSHTCNTYNYHYHPHSRSLLDATDLGLTGPDPGGLKVKDWRYKKEMDAEEEKEKKLEEIRSKKRIDITVRLMMKSERTLNFDNIEDRRQKDKILNNIEAELKSEIKDTQIEINASKQSFTACDIIAQFVYASNSNRVTEKLPVSLQSHHLSSHPDILYFNIRTLHEFLFKINLHPDTPVTTRKYIYRHLYKYFICNHYFDINMYVYIFFHMYIESMWCLTILYSS